MGYEKTIQLLNYFDSFKRAEKVWQGDRLEIREQIEEFRNTFPSKFIKEKRIESLVTKAEEIKKDIERWAKCYKNSFDRNDSFWWREFIKEYYDESVQKLKKLETNLYFVRNSDKIKKEEITPDMIARARDYPITELVEVNSAGFAHCVSGEHGDEHASMFCKNNFGYCFSCNYSADAIKIVMDINGLNFVQAVKRLAC